MKSMLPLIGALALGLVSCQSFESRDPAAAPTTGDEVSRPVGVDSGLVARLVYEGSTVPSAGQPLPTRLIIENTGSRKVTLDAHDMHTRHLRLSGDAGFIADAVSASADGDTVTIDFVATPEMIEKVKTMGQAKAAAHRKHSGSDDHDDGFQIKIGVGNDEQ